jgi:hypothetical protein
LDVDAQHVQEFNEWYNKEHLPELLSVPGILSAARYEAVKGGPQYLACYELESVAVMLSGNRFTRTAWKCRSVAWRRCCRLAACPSPPRSTRSGTPGTVGTHDPVTRGDRGFESFSLQQGVSCEHDFL